MSFWGIDDPISIKPPKGDRRFHQALQLFRWRCHKRTRTSNSQTTSPTSAQNNTHERIHTKELTRKGSHNNMQERTRTNAQRQHKHTTASTHYELSNTRTRNIIHKITHSMLKLLFLEKCRCVSNIVLQGTQKLQT